MVDMPCPRAWQRRAACAAARRTACLCSAPIVRRPATLDSSAQRKSVFTCETRTFRKQGAVRFAFITSNSISQSGFLPLGESLLSLPKARCFLELSQVSQTFLNLNCQRLLGPGTSLFLWHLCGWIERVPGGTRKNDGLEHGGAAAARIAWYTVSFPGPICCDILANLAGKRSVRQASGRSLYHHSPFL